MSESTTIRWEPLDGGVINLVLDDPNQSANTMNGAYKASMAATIDRLEAGREQITGVVITSAKKTFFAGGDLNDLRLATPADAPDVSQNLREIKGQLRRLEQLGKPVVACIDGAALGGGLEIALACHHRIATDGKGVQLGLPEVSLGLLPGGGGVTRITRLLGLASGLMNVLLQGQRLKPAKALELGVIDEVVGSADELVPKALEWIAANPEAAQPWDVKGYKIPGGAPSNPKLAANLPAFPANLRKQLKGANMPAPKAIMSAAVEGAQVDIDNAFEIEGRYFTDLVTGPVSKNMIKAFFFDLQEVNGPRGRPEDLETFRPTKVVVLGAGMMGAAISYVCALSGMEVVLKDVDQAAAERGKGYSQKLVEKGVSRGKTTQEKGDALLARIIPTTEASAAQDADLVIEAVFEDPKVKAQVFAEIEPYLKPDALLGSNTSTLPITGLAEGVSRPRDFIGLHFFSPVDKMPLLEIIRGEETSDETLYRALDVAKAIKKTPIVVNDSRGFFTSRVIGTFTQEGIAMLAEGVPAQSIEQASSQAGYPAPVLQLMDELTLTLPRKIREETKAGVLAAGGEWEDHPANAIIDRMIDEFDRKGRSSGAGFYEYDESGKRAGLWKGLKDAYPSAYPDPFDVPMEDLKERMLFAEALETVKCVDEGVLETVSDANIGSIFGIGYPAWTGGVLQYVDNYVDPQTPGRVGLAGFVERARELSARYGDRFDPPASLVAKAEAGETFAELPARRPAGVA